MSAAAQACAATILLLLQAALALVAAIVAVAVMVRLPPPLLLPHGCMQAIFSALCTSTLSALSASAGPLPALPVLPRMLLMCSCHACVGALIKLLVPQQPCQLVLTTAQTLLHKGEQQQLHHAGSGSYQAQLLHEAARREVWIAGARAQWVQCDNAMTATAAAEVEMARTSVGCPISS